MIKRYKRNGWQAVVAILIITVLWEGAVRLYSVEEWLLPAPTVIISELFIVWPAFYPHLVSTLFLVIFGFTIGTIVGLLVAMILHLFEKVKDTFYPFLILSQNIPIIVLAPLLVIWFGFGTTPKFIIITLACFFPIAISTLTGLQQTSRELTFYMQIMGASKSQMFWKLQLPHAIPSIFSGIKIAATYSVMAAVVSEWLGAQKGIGVYMTIATSSYKTSRVFVAIIMTMLLSLGFFNIILLLEKLFQRWQMRGGHDEPIN